MIKAKKINKTKESNFGVKLIGKDEKIKINVVSICTTFEKYSQKVGGSLNDLNKAWETIYSEYIPGYYFKIVYNYLYLRYGDQFIELRPNLAAFLCHRFCDKDLVEDDVDYFLNRFEKKTPAGFALLFALKKLEFTNKTKSILKKTKPVVGQLSFGSIGTFENYREKVYKLMENQEELLKFVSEVYFSKHYRKIVYQYLCRRYKKDQFSAKRPKLFAYLLTGEKKSGIKIEIEATKGTLIYVLKKLEF